MRPLYVDEKGKIWASRGYDIFFSENGGDGFSLAVSCRSFFLGRMIPQPRLLTRLLRGGFHSLIPFDDGSSVGVMKGRILKIDKGGEIKNTFNIKRGKRPLNVCLGPDHELYWGEYYDNPLRDEVGIFGSTDRGDTWQMVYRFPRGNVRHIHGIYYDEYRGGYWVLTGDKEKECRICFTGDFRDLEVVAEGGQNCRAVSVIVMKEGLIVPMDSPLEKDYIQFLDIRTGRMENIMPLPNSAFYARTAGGIHFISTAVEYSTVNTDPFSYLLASANGYDWKVIYRQKKDCWDKKLFQFGALTLPEGPCGGEYFYAGGQALQEDDGRLLKWPFKEIREFLCTS